MQLTRTTRRTQAVQATCAGCLYFVALEGEAGTCHAKPPSNGWPTVSAEDWCGGFEPKDAQP